jgi:hypothetical protein
MFDERLRQEIAMVAARFRQRRFWWVVALIWIVSGLIALAVRQFGGELGDMRVVVSSIAGAGFFSVVVALFWMLVSRFPNPPAIAKKIENTYPDLQSLLVTAVEMKPELPNAKFGFLQADVIHRTLRHARTHHWKRVVSKQSMAAAFTGALLACGLACAAFLTAILYPLPPLAKKPMITAATLVEHAFSYAVVPGNTEVERGSTLLVLVRVQGPMPLEATLVYQPEGGEIVRQSMHASLNDPVFGSRIPLLQQDTTYHVEINGDISPEYRATVFEFPRLERADAMIHYPTYAATEDRLVQDVRSVSAPEGSKVTLTCILNKSVASAVLQEKGEPPLAIAKLAGEAPNYQIELPGDKSRRWKLELTDDKGRKNTQQVEFALNILPNKPASIKPIFPARDLEVSPLEELEISATAWDDYGVKRFGLSYSFALNEPLDVLLAEDLPAKEKHERKFMLALESMAAEPDQLLSYYFWTEDVDAQGQTRRTMGDMYFAEVRPFEEIFRQGQQPPGGEQQQQQQQQQGSQNAQQAQQLAELQKEIINATWKIVRRETGATRTATFQGDVQLLRESQATAIEQAGALGERLQDEQSKAHLANVITAMGEAEGHLKAAQDGQDQKSLKPALAAEQKAYQALLKLRAREHEVVRQQQSRQQQRSQSRSSQSRSEQQLQQLDLSNEENRYEQQRTAQEQQDTPEERENRQVLNRLKELARRQHDLNERLKELQNALEEAKTEEQKEEVRNQLKRLQEEQQEILRDTDELQSRMENEENMERMAQEREQLQEARENTRRASEALEEGRVSQSAAAGARAEEEFDELKEEFRRRASGQFNEQMKDLREKARTLDENQKAIGEKLAEEAKKAAETKSLREDDTREKLVRELGEQQGRLGQLQEQMKQTITDAEETEPLLSEKLYDSIKDLNETKPDRALQSSSQSLRSGLLDDAQSQERIAAEGLSRLRESVDKAAESVLGDETAALNRARQELDRLSNELEQELQRNAPQDLTGREENRRGEREQSETNRSGERNPGQGERGQAVQDQDLAEQLSQAREGAPGQRSEQSEEGENQGERQNRQTQRSGQQGRESEQPGEGTRGEQPGESPQTEQEQRAGAQAGGRQPGGQQRESEREQGERQQSATQPNQRQGDQPGSEQNQEPSEQQGQGQQGQGVQRGQQQSSGDNRSANERQPAERSSDPEQSGEPRESQGNQRGQNQRDGNRGGEGQQGNQRGGNRNQGDRGGQFDPNQTSGDWNPNPITGDDFRDWSDRLRDVEEMVDNPELRAEAARIRDRARSMRAESQRHSKEPNFKLWRADVAEPLQMLRDRVMEELVRKTSKRALTPVDRDPTPPGFSEKTRRYYEQLGKGE